MSSSPWASISTSTPSATGGHVQPSTPSRPCSPTWDRVVTGSPTSRCSTPTTCHASQSWGSRQTCRCRHRGSCRSGSATTSSSSGRTGFGTGAGHCRTSTPAGPTWCCPATTTSATCHRSQRWPERSIGETRAFRTSRRPWRPTPSTRPTCFARRTSWEASRWASEQTTSSSIGTPSPPARWPTPGCVDGRRRADGVQHGERPLPLRAHCTTATGMDSAIFSITADSPLESGVFS